MNLWHNIIMRNKIIIFSFYIFIITGMIFIIGKKDWFPDFYYPLFMAVISFISAFAVILPKLIFKPAGDEKIKIVADLQSAIAICLLMNGAGGLGLFKLYLIGFEYDKAIHFIVSLVLFLSISEFIHKWYNMNLKKSIIISVLLIFGAGISWEILEFLSDLLFKSKSFGIYGSQIGPDTIKDVISNVLGILAGLGIKKLKNKSFI